MGLDLHTKQVLLGCYLAHTSASIAIRGATVPEHIVAKVVVPRPKISKESTSLMLVGFNLHTEQVLVGHLSPVFDGRDVMMLMGVRDGDGDGDDECEDTGMMR